MSQRKRKGLKVTHKEGDLQVWHIPQIPGKSFTVSVKTPREGKHIMDILAEYDAFQFENNIKPDYSNASGLSVWDTSGKKGEWIDWYSEEGDDIDQVEFE